MYQRTRLYMLWIIVVVRYNNATVMRVASLYGTSRSGLEGIIVYQYSRYARPTAVQACFRHALLRIIMIMLGSQATVVAASGVRWPICFIRSTKQVGWCKVPFLSSNHSQDENPLNQFPLFCASSPLSFSSWPLSSRVAPLLFQQVLWMPSLLSTTTLIVP